MQWKFFMAVSVILPMFLGILQFNVHLDTQRKNMLITVCLFTVGACGALAAMMQGQSLILWRLTERISIELFTDGVSRLYLFILALVWPLVGLYSIEYLGFERQSRLFYLWYLVTIGDLNGLVMSKNIITLYMFYECMTLATVPLVLYDKTRESIAAAIKYLIYSVFGGATALMGIFFVGEYGNGFDFKAKGMLNAASLSGHNSLTLIVLFLMLLGFSVKAGMFPMHAWLPTAHPVAPAPASAVLSGIITKMGVLGIIRVIYYVAGVELLRGTWVQYSFMALTLITVILGSTMAFKEKVLKRRLAYSSVSQVSYVLFGLSTMTVLGFVGAMLHIVFHCFIKDTLFMAAGSIIHKTGSTRTDEMIGVGKRMPVTLWCFTIVSMGLIGIPPTGGFISKWYLAEGGMELSGTASWIGPASLLVSAVLTAAYLMPVSLRGFFPHEGLNTSSFTKCEATWRMLVPMVLLSILVVVVGMFPGGLINAFTKIAQTIL